MEYYSNKDKQVAFKIFEVGLKSYGDDPAYVLTYLDHLVGVNDDSSKSFIAELTLIAL
jgi:cleavage stimulation factor subunit 3